MYTLTKFLPPPPTYVRFAGKKQWQKWRTAPELTNDLKPIPKILRALQDYVLLISQINLNMLQL